MADRPTYTGGRTVYDGRHATTGQRHTYTGKATPAKPKPEHHSGGGILAAVAHAAHVVAQKGELAARDLKAAPAGTASLANTGVIAPWWNLVTTGHPYAHGQGKKIDQAISQVSDSTEQTLKRPLHDPFATLSILSPALHGVGRVGSGAVEATRAARAGAPAADILRAAARKPEDIPRQLRVGDAKVPLVPSKHAAVRLGQAAYDRLLQRGLDRNPGGRVAKHAHKRIGGAHDEEQRMQQRMRAAPAALLDRAGLKLSRLPGHRRVQQAALELTSVQTPADVAAAYHFRQAAEGISARRNLHVGRIYQRVHEQGLLTSDEHGHVTVNAADHPKLALADSRLARVQAEGDQILAEHGVRTPEVLKARRDAPGRVRAGGHYEKPTPGKLGVVSSALKRERSRLESLQRRHEQTLTREARHRAELDAKQAGLTVAPSHVLAQMTEEQARARVAELDKQHEALLQKFVPEVNPYSAEQTAAETRSRNTLRGRMASGKKASTGRAEEGRAFAPSQTIKTVNQEVRDLAETKLLDFLDKNKNHPVAVRQRALLEERTQLRDLLNRRAEAAFGGETPPGLPKTSQPVKPAAGGELVPRVPEPSNPYRNRLVRLGLALENQQHRVASMEKQAAARVKPTGIVGGETARPGRGFVSERVSEKRLGKSEAAASRGQVVGLPRPPIDNKTYTGRALEHGFRPKDVTGSASRHFRQIVRFVNTDARRRVALQTSSATRRSTDDILARVPDETPEQLSAAIQQALGRETSTVDVGNELAVQEGLRAAYRAYVEHLIPSLKAGRETDAIGAAAPEGYRWVNRHVLGDLARQPPGPRGKLGRSVDTVNSAVTAATVYFKVGHVGTRVLTNATTNIMQGSANPVSTGRSLGLWRDLTDEEQARALAAAGQHGFSALPHEGTNVVALAAGKGAQWWARHADAAFRFNSLAYEFRKIGYGTPARFREALDHLESGGQGLPADEWAKVSAAARRADREAISYDRLNDFERRYITRAIWFYPWIKGSTLFTIRSAIEHPVKAALLGQAAVYGREQQQKQLGPTPSYEAGLLALGGGSHPLVTDLSTFSPFATSADVLEAPVQPGALAGFLNPAVGAAGQFVYGVNQYGGASTHPYTDALMAVGAATPEQQLAEAAAARGEDQSGRMFHKTLLNVLARYGGGPAVPRRVNKNALAKAAAREKSGRR